ncbi:MAG: hypothetical protein ABSA05_14850 [Opitutaceae bacterium]|jgi:hypothetical protein
MELESGDGSPVWIAEFGVTCRPGARILLDLGGSAGIGKNSRGRTAYAGIGWRF